MNFGILRGVLESILCGSQGNLYSMFSMLTNRQHIQHEYAGHEIQVLEGWKQKV